jgi:preprotein translocase subunit SecG
MEAVVLVIHLILAISIIGLVLLQRSEGGGLGIGGGGGGMGSLASAATTKNLLTRATAICAGLFFITSLTLAILAGTHTKASDLLDSLDNHPAVVDTVDENSDKELPEADNSGETESSEPSAPIAE